MSEEINECFFSCASIDYSKLKNKPEVIDINDNTSKNQPSYYQKDPKEANIPINPVINQEQEDTNDPSISKIDMNCFNKKQSNISSTSNQEKELFIIEENYSIKPPVPINHNNINDSVHIVLFPSIQSFQGNESVKIPLKLIKEDYINDSSNNNSKSSSSLGNKSPLIASQIDQIEEEAFSKASHRLILEELPDKKDYNGTSYKPYHIVKYNKQSKDFETKCERRFDNIDAFYSKITRKYPYIILPKLSQKNALRKLITNDSFFLRRKKQLSFLLNYIYSSPSLSVLPEVSSFINSIEFNETYYKSTSDDFIGDLHIKNNTMNKLKSSVYSYFKQSGDSDEKYLEINKIHSFYERIASSVEKMKNEIGAMCKASMKSATNYSDIGSDLSFIREVKSINKEEIKLYEEIAMRLSQSRAVYEALYDKFDYFSLLMQGLVEMMERYDIFMKRLKLIRETYQDYVKNTANYASDIPSIKDKAEEKKKVFEKELFSSIDAFVGKFVLRFPQLIYEFKELLLKENEAELTQLKVVS